MTAAANATTGISEEAAEVTEMMSADWNVGSMRCLPGRISSMKTLGWKAGEADVEGAAWISA